MTNFCGNVTIDVAFPSRASLEMANSGEQLS